MKLCFDVNTYDPQSMRLGAKVIPLRKATKEMVKTHEVKKFEVQKFELTSKDLNEAVIGGAKEIVGDFVKKVQRKGSPQAAMQALGAHQSIYSFYVPPMTFEDEYLNAATKAVQGGESIVFEIGYKHRNVFGRNATNSLIDKFGGIGELGPDSLSDVGKVRFIERCVTELKTMDNAKG